MGLNFEGGGMFGREPPPVDLNPRAFKDGATVKSFSFNAQTATTVFTIPVGYVFYIDTILAAQYDTGGGNLILKDNATEKFYLDDMPAEGDFMLANFQTPLIFETSLVNTDGGTVDIWCTVSGWIEKA